MLLSAAAIAIAGGIKTAAGGGGYGSLQLLLNENYGLYEGSIMSAVGISIIPLILWYRRHGTIFPPDWRVSLFCFALVFACALLPIGTQARTGLVCLVIRSEEHTSELQSLMRISYAVFCMKKKITEPEI